jgi:hypothetical protein
MLRCKAGERPIVGRRWSKGLARLVKTWRTASWQAWCNVLVQAKELSLVRDHASAPVLSPITSRAAWRGDQLSQGQDWVYELSAAQVAELEALGTRFMAENPDLRTVQAQDYPLVETAQACEEWRQEVEFGRGFVLVRGLRAELYSDALSCAIYYILGLHMGDPIRQNEMGDLLDHVYATSDKTMDDPTALSSKVRDKLVYHSDSSDIVALMCLRGAREGGLSCLVSGAEIYNEILRRRPDLAPLLFEPFHWDWRRQDHEAPADTYTSPIVSLKDGVFSMYAGSLYILTAQEYEGVPKLTGRPDRSAAPVRRDHL